MIYQDEKTIAVFSPVLNRIADNVMITDRRGMIEYVNPAFETTTGYSSQEVVGQTPKILRSGQHDSAYYQKLWETILAGKVFRATTINKKKNGDIYHADQTISSVKDDSGEIIYFVSVWKDITERIINEEKLKKLNEQLLHEKKKMEQVLGIEAVLHSIFDLHKLIDFVVDKTCEVLQAGKCSIMFVDEDSGELCIKGHRGIEESRIGEIPLRIGSQAEDLIELHRTNTQSNHSLKCRGSLKIDGTVYQSEAFLSTPIYLGEQLLGIVNVSDKKGEDGRSFTNLDLKILLMIVRQVKVAIDNAKLYRKLKYLTLTDPLTGIYNFRYFSQTMDYEILRAKRYNRDFSFLMMDIDQFKSYNDTFGHLEGDKLLKAVAQIIKQNVRQMDGVCRYGGDEFTVILPETDLSQARITAEKIRRKVAELSLRRPVTISIGVTQYVSPANRHELIRKADNALYAAKRQGRNRISG